jgi:hypothetical protein
MISPDWIVTRIRRNTAHRSEKACPLAVEGVNLNHPRVKTDVAEMHGECERYFHWKVPNVYDPRYDIGHAVIEEDVPLALLQPCRRNG